MSGIGPSRWLRDARRAMARLPNLRMGRIPDAPVLPVRDPWPGDAGRGARLVKGELELAGSTRPLRPGIWGDTSGSPALRTAAHSFTWLRDLRALGTDAARLRARALVADWIAAPQLEGLTSGAAGPCSSATSRSLKGSCGFSLNTVVRRPLCWSMRV